MSGAMFFLQSCPVCGRHLEVRLRHLGKNVNCVHCGGEFIATDPEAGRSSEPARDLIGRADQLLDRARNIH